jgi:hypothetical protein
MDYPRPYQDTTPEALEVWLDLLRKMPAGKKLIGALDLSDFVFEIAQSGVRSDFPEADEREVFLRTVARHLTREEMNRVYGWNPELHDQTRRSATACS